MKIECKCNCEHTSIVDSPIGELTITATVSELKTLAFDSRTNSGPCIGISESRPLAIRNLCTCYPNYYESNGRRKNANNANTVCSCLLVLFNTEDELNEYFAGKRSQFSIPLSTEVTGNDKPINYGSKTPQAGSTAFQRQVWNCLYSIPYGTTMSYAEVASKINHENAFRAVGNANNRNPIPLIIPCHRVVKKSKNVVENDDYSSQRKKPRLVSNPDHNDSCLGGFGGGIWRKKWLLDHEQFYCEKLNSTHKNVKITKSIC